MILYFIAERKEIEENPSEPLKRQIKHQSKEAVIILEYFSDELVGNMQEKGGAEGDHNH